MRAAQSRPPRVDVHAGDAVLARDSLLARAQEGIEALAQLHIHETESAEEVEKLSLRESAGDSTGPEVDVLADGLRQLARDDDVSVEEATAGSERAEDLAIRARLVGREIQDAVR